MCRTTRSYLALSFSVSFILVFSSLTVPVYSSLVPSISISSWILSRDLRSGVQIATLVVTFISEPRQNQSQEWTLNPLQILIILVKVRIRIWAFCQEKWCHNTIYKSLANTANSLYSYYLHAVQCFLRVLCLPRWSVNICLLITCRPTQISVHCNIVTLFSPLCRKIIGLANTLFKTSKHTQDVPTSL